MDVHPVFDSEQPVSGLKNCGNTCFLNTAVQLLLAIPPIRDDLVRRGGLPFSEWVDGIPEDPDKVHLGSKVLVWQMSRVAKGLLEEYCIVRPSAFLRAFAREMSGYPLGEQHDSHEIFVQILEHIHKAVGEVVPYSLTDSESDAHEESIKRYLFEKHLKGYLTSPLVDSVYGQEHITIECTSCGHKIHKRPLFTTFGVTLPSIGYATDRLSLTDCLGKECARHLSGDDWCCDKCKAHGAPMREMEITRWPKYFIVHLKRFNMRTVGARLFLQKNNSYVDFDLDDNDFYGNHYRCIAIANHGGGMGGGHYWSYIRRGRRWFEANDCSVTPMMPERVISSAAYYMVFEKIETSESE